MLDQVFEKRVGKAILVCPLRIAEDAVQGVRVGLLDATHGLLERVPDVFSLFANVFPVTALGNLKPMVLGEQSERPVTLGLL